MSWENERGDQKLEEKNSKNFAVILNKHYECLKVTAKEILEELKKDSKNYGEVKYNLEKFKRDTLFECGNSQRYGNLLMEIESILEKEMNDLPLTNRSE